MPHETKTDIYMIREKTLLFKINQINISDRELLGSKKLRDKPCPITGAVGCLKPNGTYTRWVISIHHGVREEYEITVARVFCTSCGHTHALLPDALIPYGSYSLRFILHVLRAYLKRKGTVADLCEGYSISRSTLYTWIHRFTEHANLWFQAFERISQITLRILDFFEDIERLPSAFFEKFRFSFLQNHLTTRSSALP